MKDTDQKGEELMVEPNDSVSARARRAAEREVKKKSLEKAKKKGEVPVRPRGLRGELLSEYNMLAVAVCVFVYIGFSLQYELAQGMYELRNGDLIKLEDFNPVDHRMQPYPHCHERHGQHLANDGKTWLQNDEINVDDIEKVDIPVGHPEHPDWVEAIEEIIKENDGNVWSWEVFQPSLHTLVLATLCVLIGCKHAVWMYVRPYEDDEDAHTEEVPQSALKDEDAYMFPIMGSCVLFGLFLIYKYLGTDWIKFFITGYIALMSTNGLGMNMSQYVGLRSGRRDLSKFSTLFTIPYFDVKVTYVDIVAYVIAISLGVQYMLTKNWIINNLMGISFCLLGLKHIGLSSYRTGAILLLGLFVYDVFWVFGSKSVFGSNVMVTVATGVEAPIKLMFPRKQDGCGKLQFSMLGLGDIVVPGIFIGFLAKFDVKRSSSVENAPSKDKYLYFNVTMVAYVLSLVTTIMVMLVFHHAQPALLYIVPYILIASFGLAVYKGEVSQLLEFKVEDTLLEEVIEEEESIVEWVKGLIWPSETKKKAE
uniref:Uncharacterized protein n=1 Tax=Aplanochytrium stocchinoi TaxID=215587 RepID=A0A7S3PJS3_9STRA|eukprot:CAMPEP_0204824274 /NCGR_PEP_ID=MMETSP1346-20131115/2306_1 /ASSEMBLY_ACC=CAM_ASM_000771 /TAXON_ID=215587 /ORGANISM="Aplanochytrium stocchinoi, Strain GSBS06" /LENGTH=534 /DNA_ID=CAMNT_0051951335 /DNA_START=40 /DNA_END=1644 /DNA_ORIENTATION=-